MIGRRGMLIVVLASLVVGGSIGLIGGVLFARSVFRDPHMIARKHMGPPRGRDGPRSLPREMRELDLTPEQEAKLLDEIEHSRGDFRAVRETLRVRIARHLTPEQRKEWERAQRSFVHRDRDRPWPRPRPADPGPRSEERR